MVEETAEPEEPNSSEIVMPDAADQVDDADTTPVVEASIDAPAVEEMTVGCEVSDVVAEIDAASPDEVAEDVSLADALAEEASVEESHDADEPAEEPILSEVAVDITGAPISGETGVENELIEDKPAVETAQVFDDAVVGAVAAEVDVDEAPPAKRPRMSPVDDETGVQSGEESDGNAVESQDAGDVTLKRTIDDVDAGEPMKESP